MAIAMVSSSSALVLIIITIIASLLCDSTQAQTSSPCDHSFSFFGEGIARSIRSCRRLRTLGAELGWSYHHNANTNTSNVTVDIVFSAIPSTANGWVAWGVNPGRRPQMVGTRALIAFLGINGTLAMNTYNVTGDTMRGYKLQPSPIEVKAENMMANYSGETGAIIMAARLSLDPSTYNISKLKHVWQVGSHVIDQVPQMHAMRLKNFDSFEVVDLTSGRGFRDRGLMMERAAHGVLSIVGWGILLPMGVIIKRYSFLAVGVITKGKKRTEHPIEQQEGNARKSQKIWLVLHIAFQISAYTVGTTAWAIGIALMSNSGRFKSFKAHRIIGILIFCLATLQITALCLKPKKVHKKKDNIDYRKFWNIYHHLVGYSLVALSLVNIFKGFAILQPPSVWKWIYVGVLAILSCAVIGLEIATWNFAKK